MRISEKIKNNVADSLSQRIRGAIVFAPKEILRSKRVAKKTAEELHAAVSGSMQHVYQEHIVSKEKDLHEALKHRELVYVDASKKGDMDLFSYMTQQYFNVCSEEVRTKYNAMRYQYHPELFDGESGSDDAHFARLVADIRKSPGRQEYGETMLIGFIPLHNIGMLMLLNDQQDFNIFLDNVETVTPAEMGVINSAIRSGLLVSYNQRMGLYINNTKDMWNFLAGAEDLPPQDGHDMRVVYM